MYAIVSDVERYPQFVPWCAAQRVLKRETVGPREILLCETVVGFRGLRERYQSRATLNRRDMRVDVEHVEGVFRRLQTHWRFAPQGPAERPACRIDFAIDYEFKSRMLAAVASGAFLLVIARMTHAFEERAGKLSKR